MSLLSILVVFLVIAGVCWLIARYIAEPTLRTVLLIVVVVVLGGRVLLSAVGILPPLQSLRWAMHSRSRACTSEIRSPYRYRRQSSTWPDHPGIGRWWKRALHKAERRHARGYGRLRSVSHCRSTVDWKCS
jgi:hypothetical protein